jgi:hypothetical protein
MVFGDFDPSQQPGMSEEVASHVFEECLLAEDWGQRFSGNSATHNALGEALATEQDPARVIDLVERRQSSLVATLGAGAISLWQRDVLTERQQFDAEFNQ